MASFIYEYLIPSILIFLGVSGNLIGFIIFSRKTLSKFPTRNIYRFMAILDTIYLLSQIAQDTSINFGYDFRIVSDLICKLYRYYNFALAPISFWLSVYISIERFISIKYRNVQFIKNRNFQTAIILVISLYNLFFYSPMLVFLNLIENVVNGTNSTQQIEKTCDYKIPIYLTVISTMDLINIVILPFFIMTIMSILLIHTIIMSRLKILNLSLEQDRIKLAKDIKFGITSIILNITFFFLNLPICLANYMEMDNNTYTLIVAVFYVNYFINFYILAFFNSVFRKELYIWLGLKKFKIRSLV